MNKFRSSVLLTTITMAGHLYAGGIGPALINNDSKNVVFTAIEGSYTWDDVGNFILNNFTETSQRNGWGGRVSVGLARPYSNGISLSSEAGWGYFGKSTYDFDTIGVSGTYTLYGFDLLFGVIKSYKYLDIFAKAGAMAETTRSTSVSELSRSYPGGLISGEMIQAKSATNVLPEIKVGGIYNVNDRLGISLAYMYLAGWNASGTAKNQVTQSGAILNSNLISGPPAFHSIMLGIRYNIA